MLPQNDSSSNLFAAEDNPVCSPLNNIHTIHETIVEMEKFPFSSTYITGLLLQYANKFKQVIF